MAAFKDDTPNNDDLPYPEHIANDHELKWIYTPHPDDTRYPKYLGIDREGQTRERCRRTGCIGTRIAAIETPEGRPFTSEEIAEHLVKTAAEHEMSLRKPDTDHEPPKGTT